MKVYRLYRLRGLIGGLIGCLGMNLALNLAPVQAGQADFLPQIGAAAQQAERECNHLMHDNADEYVNCLDTLDRDVKGKAKDVQLKRLGFAYFGWVGATRWGRTSLPGSDEAALRYYLRFLPLQQQLKITDQDLCGTVAGSCQERLAQLDEIKKVVAAKKRAKKS